MKYLAILVLLSTISVNLAGAESILEPCPQSPNCVSTDEDPSDTQHYVDPIPFGVSTDQAFEAVLEVLENMPRTVVTSTQGFEVHAESRVAVFGFVDDVTIVVDESDSVVRFRSASRVGYSDLGVNRRRYQRFRELFLDRLRS
jgi:uncharacterized protein (DUF1499 family)